MLGTQARVWVGLDWSRDCLIFFLQVCQRDYYCPGLGPNNTFVCPDGKYSLAGSDSVGDCVCPEYSSSRPNSKYVQECTCDPGYYRLYSNQYAIGGWFCAPCNPGQDCYNNSNYTCPDHSSSYAMAKAYTDCYCLS